MSHEATAHRASRAKEVRAAAGGVALPSGRFRDPPSLGLPQAYHRTKPDSIALVAVEALCYILGVCSRWNLPVGLAVYGLQGQSKKR